MFVVKRDGRKEDVKFDKITSRINKLCYGLDSRFVDSIKISQKVRRCEGKSTRSTRSIQNTTYVICFYRYFSCYSS